MVKMVVYMLDMRCFLAVAAVLVLSGEGAYHKKVIPTDGDCMCLPYYQCQNGTVIEDGTALIDIRIRVARCENYLEVCCKVPRGEKPDDKGKEHHGEIPEWGSCGVRHPKGVAFRITGDKDGEAQFGEYPWMAAIMLSHDVADHVIQYSMEEPTEAPTMKHVLKYLCGGSLIHPKVVLTGAHCVERHVGDNVIIRVGEWDSQTKNEIYPNQDRVVSHILIHPDFKNNSLFNDVALLFFAEPIRPAKHIGIVCLPKKKQLPPAKTRCLASGWGMTDFDKKGEYSTILKRVELPVIDFHKCQAKLRNTRLGVYFKLHKSFMCAGGEKGIDTCKGDGGSPLVCPHPEHPEHYIQSGIVAWGIGCRDQEIPGVYVNVAHLRDWIDEKMMVFHLDTSYYTLPEE